MLYWIIVIVKSFAYYLLWDENMSEKLDWIPFMSHKFQSSSNLLEAEYFLSKNMNPYMTEQIYQKPLVIYGLQKLKETNLDMFKFYFLFIDMLIGHYFKAYLFRNEKLGYRRAISLIYHLHPITFISLLVNNTDGIDYLTMLMCLGSIYQYKGVIGHVSSAILFGLLTYLNPQYLIVLSVVLVVLKLNNRDSAVRFVLSSIVYMIIASATVAGLMQYSFILTGDWRCYIDVYYPINFYPTMGFLWALFSGLFSRYTFFYHTIYMIFPICFIFPFYSLFAKYGVNTKCPNFLGLMTGCVLFTAYLYFHQVTAMNHFMSALFLFQRYDRVVSNRIAIVTLYTATFIPMIAYGLELTWTQSLTGNPNFLFFQVFVFYLFAIVIVTESIREFLKEQYYIKKEK